MGIFKSAEKDKDTGESNHVVFGLTTATSLWLSAAVGVSCGGRLYFVASFSAAIMLILLRFGPRGTSNDDEEEEEEETNASMPLKTYTGMKSSIVIPGNDEGASEK